MACFNVGNRIINPNFTPWGKKGCKIPSSLFFYFDDGDVSTFSGDWIVTSNKAYEGTNSYRSQAIDDDQISETTITRKCNYLSFYYYCSSEENYDFFRFYIDGTEMFNDSGESASWIFKEYELTKAEHTFQWEYSKDSSASGGDDCVYIDNVKIVV